MSDVELTDPHLNDFTVAELISILVELSPTIKLVVEIEELKHKLGVESLAKARAEFMRDQYMKERDEAHAALKRRL